MTKSKTKLQSNTSKIQQYESEIVNRILVSKKWRKFIFLPTIRLKLFKNCNFSY